MRINEWMQDSLRNQVESLNRMPLQWLEIERTSWTPLVSRAISFIINGGTFLLSVDSKREWLQKYILSNLNSPNIQRPFIPVYSFDSSLTNLLNENNNQAVKDILDMSYNRYALWYIGSTADNAVARFALDTSESFLWIFDEPLEHSFTLSSNDTHLDFKLLQLYQCFEKTLFAGIFGEFEIE